MSTIVYILGTSYSGSTLLHTLLDRHPLVIGVNELVSIDTFVKTMANQPDNPLRLPFWEKVGKCYEAATGQPFSALRIAQTTLGTLRLTPSEKATWIARNEALYRCIFHVSGRPVIVDSSKHTNRLGLLLQSDLRASLRVVYLVRDARGVYRSAVKRGYTRRYMLRSMFTHALLSDYLLRKLPPHQKFRLRYESLIDEPEAMLRELTAFAGLDYTAAMLNAAVGSRKTSVALGGKGQSMAQNTARGTISPERMREGLKQQPGERLRFLLYGGGLINLYYGNHERREIAEKHT